MRAPYHRKPSQRTISKRNQEREAAGLDMIPKEKSEAMHFACSLREYLLSDEERLESCKPGILEFSHIANESELGDLGILRNRASMGVRKGMPDYFLAIRDEHNHVSSLWIELKTRRTETGAKTGTEKPEQKRMISILQSIPNTNAYFAHGQEEAIEIVLDHIFPGDRKRKKL